MPEILYEHHRGRGIAVGAIALMVVVLIVAAIALRGPINDLLYRLGVLHVNVNAVLSQAEGQRRVSNEAGAVDTVKQALPQAYRKDDKVVLYAAVAAYDTDLGRNDESLKYYLLKRSLVPSDHSDSLNIARVYIALGQPKQAEPYFREALDELKKHPNIPNLKGEQADIEQQMKDAGLSP
jgi:tetratricopeptide (TPR) repeat protein